MYMSIFSLLPMYFPGDENYFLYIFSVCTKKEINKIIDVENLVSEFTN